MTPKRDAGIGCVERPNPPVGYIESIGVLPDRRGEGLGALLLRLGVAWLSSCGCSRAELHVALSNSAALRLYERNGFRIVTTRQWLSAPAARVRSWVDQAFRANGGRPYGELRAEIAALRTEFVVARRRAGSPLPVVEPAPFRDALHRLGSGDLRDGMRRTGLSVMDAIALRHVLAGAPEPLRAALAQAAERAADTMGLESFHAEHLRSSRPTPDDAYAQGPDEPASALARAHLLATMTPLTLVRVLVLGDEDAVAPLVACLGCPTTCALDVDERLLDYETAAADRAGLALAAVRTDLRDGLPRFLHGRFDAVTADPPSSVESIATFAAAARDALRPADAGYVLLAVAPAWLGLPGLLAAQRELADLGMVVVDQRAGVLETRLQPTLLAVREREPILGELPVTFSDVWMLRLVPGAEAAR